MVKNIRARSPHSEIIRFFGHDDPSRRLMEEILANEEGHAEDLRTLTERLGKEG